jgi:biotin transport system substrate-specific component
MNTRNMIFISLFTALMAAGAFIKIPLPFMSVTFQLFFAVTAGIILGPVRGLIAMVVYMAIGLIGIPVFTLGGGPAYVLQPSFGFILGFIPAAYIAGLLYERYSLYPAYIAGILAAYLIGIPYLFIILRYYLGNAGATLWTTAGSMAIYLAKDVILGFVLFAFSKRIPRLKKITLT